MTSRQLLLEMADTLTESELAEVLEYIGIMESLREDHGRAGVYDDTLMAAWARSFLRRDRGRQGRTPGVKGMGSLRI